MTIQGLIWNCRGLRKSGVATFIKSLIHKYQLIEPQKHLGVPVSPSRLHVRDWLPLLEKTAKRLDVWKGSSMSIASRSSLISSSLNNAPTYHMSMYLLPKTVVHNMDKARRTFFWQGGHVKRKYHLVKWIKIYSG